MTKQKVVMVLGCHRSGTSVITKALELLGCDLGPKLMPPGPANPLGFFEDLDIVALNDEILSRHNKSWKSLEGPMPEGDAYYAPIMQPYYDKAKTLITSRLTQGKIFAFKDPRATRTLPFWHEVFNQLNVDLQQVIIIRHPMSVAASLHARDHLTQAEALALWYDYNFRILRYLRSLHPIVFNYDAVIASPRSAVYKLGTQLFSNHHILMSEPYAADAFEKFIEANLRHHKADPDEIIPDSRAELVWQTFQNFL